MLEGQKEFLRRLRRVSDDRALMKATSNAFRKSEKGIRSEIIKRARTRGILKSIFGRRPAGLGRMVKLGRVRKILTNFQAPLTAGGLMAIQERGGRLKPHTIKPKNAPRLVFVTHGRLVAVPLVRHPGATHPKMPVFWPAVRRSGSILRRDMAEAIRAHLRAAGRVA